MPLRADTRGSRGLGGFAVPAQKGSGSRDQPGGLRPWLSCQGPVLLSGAAGPSCQRPCGGCAKPGPRATPVREAQVLALLSAPCSVRKPQPPPAHTREDAARAGAAPASTSGLAELRRGALGRWEECAPPFKTLRRKTAQGRCGGTAAPSSAWKRVSAGKRPSRHGTRRCPFPRSWA